MPEPLPIFLLDAHICTNWAINYSGLIWALTLHFSGIIRWHTCPGVLYAPIPYSHASPMIIGLGYLKVSRFILIPYEAILRFFFHIFRSCFICLGIWMAWCALPDFISITLILFIKRVPMKTTTVMVSIIPVIYCSSLRPTILLFITILDMCDYAMTLWNGKINKNWNVLIYQPRHIFCSDGDPSASHFPSA